jgi:hypothetical protein
VRVGDRVCAVGEVHPRGPPRRGRAWVYSVPFSADALDELRWLVEARAASERADPRVCAGAARQETADEQLLVSRDELVGVVGERVEAALQRVGWPAAGGVGLARPGVLQEGLTGQPHNPPARSWLRTCCDHDRGGQPSGQPSQAGVQALTGTSGHYLRRSKLLSPW